MMQGHKQSRRRWFFAAIAAAFTALAAMLDFILGDAYGFNLFGFTELLSKSLGSGGITNVASILIWVVFGLALTLVAWFIDGWRQEKARLAHPNWEPLLKRMEGNLGTFYHTLGDKNKPQSVPNVFKRLIEEHGADEATAILVRSYNGQTAYAAFLRVMSSMNKNGLAKSGVATCLPLYDIAVVSLAHLCVAFQGYVDRMKNAPQYAVDTKRLINSITEGVKNEFLSIKSAGITEMRANPIGLSSNIQKIWQEEYREDYWP